MQTGIRHGSVESGAQQEQRFPGLLKGKGRSAGILPAASCQCGADAHVTVKLPDKRKLTGYVGEAREESFTIIDSKSGVAITVAYAQVVQVKGHNLSSGVKIAVGIAIVAAILIIAIVAASVKS